MTLKRIDLYEAVARQQVKASFSVVIGVRLAEQVGAGEGAVRSRARENRNYQAHTADAE
jgi:hypothetical protein